MSSSPIPLTVTPPHRTISISPRFVSLLPWSVRPLSPTPQFRIHPIHFVRVHHHRVTPYSIGLTSLITQRYSPSGRTRNLGSVLFLSFYFNQVVPNPWSRPVLYTEVSHSLPVPYRVVPQDPASSLGLLSLLLQVHLIPGRKPQSNFSPVGTSLMSDRVTESRVSPSFTKVPYPTTPGSSYSSRRRRQFDLVYQS